MADPNPIKPERIEPSQPIGGGQSSEETTTPSRSFSSYMNETPPSANAMPSPFDLPGGKNAQDMNAAGPSMDTVVAKANESQATLGDIANQLGTPNLKLNHSQKYVLQNKLGNASDLLRSANVRLGANPGEPPNLSAATGPLGKFLSLVNDGTAQIANAKQQISSISSQGTEINPADMLLIQMKLNKAQQELEFSSILLSKAVDDFKQLMNTQI